MFPDKLQEGIVMSLCDPDAGRSKQGDRDVTAATLPNVNELTGIRGRRFFNC